MSLSTTDHTNPPLHLKKIYDPIGDELALVEAKLQQELRNPHPFIDQLVRHSFRLGGKRLRPVLLLLTAKALGEVKSEHITLSCVVEMIHTATLLHDDVLDEADVRRHLPTINARWNNEASVLSGDYLFSHAFYLASTTGSARACSVIGRATNLVCDGELRQINSRGNLALDESEYLEIIEAKTAELTACCCLLGTFYTESSPEVAHAATQFGRFLGIAFQIADDVLDVFGEEENAGKSLGTDLEKQKLTLPFIRLLDTASENDREKIRHLLGHPSSDSRNQLRSYLAASDAMIYTQQRAAQFIDLAIQELANFPQNEVTESLRSAAEFAIARKS